MNILTLILPLLFTVPIQPARTQTWPQEKYDNILSSIKAPVFKPDTIWLEAGNRNKFLTETINKAIEHCSANGGGTVALKPGVFHTAGIILRSNVNLHLCDGAIIRFSGNPNDYLPVVRTRWEGMDCMNYRPLIYAIGVQHIAITGNGEIDGSATSENWWWMKGRKEFGFVKGMPSQNSTGRPLLQQYNDDSTPIERRIMGDGSNLRPQLINIIESENILIEGITIRNSPFWVIHPLLCRNFILRGVTVSSFGPNNDGCDPESCDGVLIEDCTFSTGDDCIAIKSGRNNDGRKWAVPSRNIIIRRCHFASGHGGVTIGSEISGGFDTLFAEDCYFDGADLRNALRFKSNRSRGGEISNVFVRRFNVLSCSRSCIEIDMQYEDKEQAGKIFEPKVNGVSISEFNVGSCKSFLKMTGSGDQDCISNLFVADSHIRSCEEKFILTGGKPDKIENIVFE